jgi:hypothetical protein
LPLRKEEAAGQFKTFHAIHETWVMLDLHPHSQQLLAKHERATWMVWLVLFLVSDSSHEAWILDPISKHFIQME